MAKFKVGDKVTVVSKVPADKVEWPRFIAEMTQYLGKQCIVRNVRSDGPRQAYVLDHGFTWYEGWLRPAGPSRDKRRLLCA